MADNFLQILAAVLGLLVFPVNELIQTAYKLRKQSVSKETYSERLDRLTKNLSSSTKEVDDIISELSAVAKQRESAIKKLENEVDNLEGKESRLKERIEELESTPIAVVEHFAGLTAAGEKRSAKRDFLLFGAGVVISTLIAIVLQTIGH